MMTIKLYRIKRKHKPSESIDIFSDENYIKTLHCAIPDYIKHQMIEFIMKINLLFGNEYDYDWDRKECHNMSLQENLLINSFYSEFIGRDMKDHITGIMGKFDLKTYKKNDGYDNYFSRIDIDYECLHLEFDDQLCYYRQDMKLTPSFVSSLSYRFTIK